ncbi:MAG TPA: hypothetical protein V6D12_18950, partial [Candidatus Obscuribacterales bacterium]
WGLLDNFSAISHRQGWLKCLSDHCAIIKGHQLFWRKDADPYQLKVLRSAVKSRQGKERLATNYITDVTDRLSVDNQNLEN